MERIAYELLIDILKFFTIEELFKECIMINTEWRRAIRSIHLLQYLVRREYNLRFLPKLPADQCYRILKAQKKDPKLLEFIGFITSGGVFENAMEFWCMNLFRSKGEAYCSYDNSENCNIGGVLLDSMVDPRTYFDSVSSVIESVQRYLNSEATDIFEKISLRKTLKLLDMTQEDVVIELLSTSEIEVPNIDDVKRHSDNDYILHHKIDTSHSDESQFYGVVRTLCISRSGYYTCPVKSLLVFISDRFIDVTDGVFSIFNNIRSYKDLKTLIANDTRVPEVYKHYDGVRAQYCEFLPGFDLKIIPIVWVRFKINTITIPLSHNFTGKYIYVKLIYPDDRRDGRHEGVNIDCNSVLPYGHIINLGLEYNE